MPRFRRLGHGTELAEQAAELSRELGLPLRYIASFADVGPSNYAAMQHFVNLLGLTLQNNHERWSPYMAVPAGEAIRPLQPAVLPPRAIALTSGVTAGGQSSACLRRVRPRGRRSMFAEPRWTLRCKRSIRQP